MGPDPTSPTTTPDGVQYATPGGAQPAQSNAPASKVMIDQRDGKFLAQCLRPGDPRPTPSPLLPTFPALISYLAQEFQIAPPGQSAGPNAGPPAGPPSAAPPSTPPQGGSADADEDDQ